MLYGQEATTAGETAAPRGGMQEVVTLPLGYYEKGVAVRERVGQEVIASPDTGWTIKHYFETTTSEVYDNNIFNEEDNEIDDFVTTVSPQGRVDFLTKKLFITSSYRVDNRYYQYLGDEYFDHTLGGQVLYQFSPRFMMSLSDIYRKNISLKGIEGTDILSTGQIVDKTDSNTFTFRSEYDFIRGGNKLWLKYFNKAKGVHYHSQTRDFSSKRHVLGLGWTHSFTRRSSISPGLEFTRYRDRDVKKSDFDGSALTCGFKHVFSTVLEAEGKLGFQYRDFVNKEREENIFQTSLGLTSRLSPRTTITADYSFDKPPTYGSAVLYDEYKFGAGITYLVTRLFKAKTSAIYTFKDYENGREREGMDSGVSVEYDLGKKLSTSLSYRFHKLNSTDATEEYTDGVYMLTVKSKLW